MIAYILFYRQNMYIFIAAAESMYSEKTAIASHVLLMYLFLYVFYFIF